jgi:hypothetical protein
MLGMAFYICELTVTLGITVYPIPTYIFLPLADVDEGIGVS